MTYQHPGIYMKLIAHCTVQSVTLNSWVIINNELKSVRKEKVKLN